MPPSKAWQLYPANPEKQKLLSEALGISLITAQILVNRGIESLESAQIFLSPSLKNLPSPFLIPNMDLGIRRVMEAIQKKESIAIYGDYDVDGLTATALLATFFKEIGVDVTTYIPDRVKEGYGLQAEALKSLQAKGVSLVITADCGTKSHTALAEAKNIGLDVIVTDHHELDATPPPAFAFINPQLLPKGNPEQSLAGVGVIFFLIMALRQKMREEKLFTQGEPNLKQHLDLVAMGTIGDMVPITGINRILVRFGLQELSQTKKPGLIALKEISGLATETDIDCSDIGFRLAPKINAGGRISKASLGLDLLCSTDLERATKLAKILDQCNQDRQTMQEKQVKQAIQQVGEKNSFTGLVVASADWHPGIVGLIASKLTEKFQTPSIALSLSGELARGSVRSISGLHIVEILEECKDLLEQFGGHANAAGLTLKTAQIKNFEERFANVLERKMTENSFTPTLHVDCELQLSEIHDNLLKEIQTLKPFGIKNPEPVFLSRQLQFQDMRVVGEKHLKFKVSDNFTQLNAIAFNMVDSHPKAPEKGDVAFVPQWNTYQNKTTIQLKVKDLKKA